MTYCKNCVYAINDKAECKCRLRGRCINEHTISCSAYVSKLLSQVLAFPSFMQSVVDNSREQD